MTRLLLIRTTETGRAMTELDNSIAIHRGRVGVTNVRAKLSTVNGYKYQLTFFLILGHLKIFES